MKSNKLIIVLIIVICITIGYFFFLRGGNIATDSLLIPTPPTEITTEDIVLVLSRLQTIRFSESVFNDERFLRLVDNSVELGTQPVGRSNPFTEVGTDAPISDEPVDITTEENVEGDTTIIIMEEVPSATSTESVE